MCGRHLDPGSVWVSNARLLAGRGAATHTHCDDLPPTCIMPFPPPRQVEVSVAGAGAPAGAALAEVCAQEDRNKGSRRGSFAKHGCRYQSDVAWARVKTAGAKVKRYNPDATSTPLGKVATRLALVPFKLPPTDQPASDVGAAV